MKNPSADSESRATSLEAYSHSSHSPCSCGGACSSSHPHEQGEGKRPQGLSLDAYSPQLAAPAPHHEHPHGHEGHHAHSSAPAGNGLLNVQCSCGGSCGHFHSGNASEDGHGHSHAHEHGHDHSHGDGPPWRRLALAGLFAVLSEGFHFALEGGAFGVAAHGGMPGGFSLPEVLPLVFALVAVALSGVETYRAGWRAIRRFDLNMMALMSVAVTGALLIGQWPEAAMVMVLFNISEAIEDRVLDRARRAIRDLLALSPEKATVLQPDGSWQEAEVSAVRTGSLVRVKPGERIPLDGTICEGRSAVDQAPITGESLPVEKGPGDAVFAGTINMSGSFDFEVTAAASDTTLARIIHAVEKAQAGRAPVQRFVDAFARCYTPCVFAASLLIALVPPIFMGAQWLDSVYKALVVLVIGCPCALVISTPVTIVSGLAAATRRGMLVKGGVFLEQGRQLRVLALDKTGTLTHGRPRLTDIAPVCGHDGGEEWDDEAELARALHLASSLAARSDHPVSRAIAEAGAEKGGAYAEVKDFSAVAGRGVSGMLAGQLWRLGSMRMMEEAGILTEADFSLTARAAGFEMQGKTVVALAGNGRIRALFAVADTLRESSVQAVRELRELGVKTVMLTGDNENSARAIAALAGVDDFRAQLLPEEKLAAIEDLEKAALSEERGGSGKIGMAGDGINDAPALARADIGFAMAGCGTDTAMETADVAIMADDLRKIPRFIRLSRAVYGILMQNIALALGVKALFFALTLAGCTSMWMAVFADVGTALMVVGNGLRAGRK
ncbi:MAG: heavy metal translocating P-type ATPase [Mailhella sp.]|nr:heavy metal translocating P-type ATPase [Mailhella sp.]